MYIRFSSAKILIDCLSKTKTKIIGLYNFVNFEFVWIYKLNSVEL